MVAISPPAGWGPSDVVALVAIASTLFVAVFVAVFTHWASGQQQREGRREEREDRRWRDAISLLGPVYGLLVDADPQGLAVRGIPVEDAPGHLAEQRRRWESEMRPGLLAIAVGSHQKSQRELAAELSAAIDAELVKLIWYAEEVLLEKSSTDLLDKFRREAVDEHRKAKGLLDQLAASIRDENP